MSKFDKGREIYTYMYNMQDVVTQQLIYENHINNIHTCIQVESQT